MGARPGSEGSPPENKLRVEAESFRNFFLRIGQCNSRVAPSCLHKSSIKRESPSRGWSWVRVPSEEIWVRVPAPSWEAQVRVLALGPWSFGLRKASPIGMSLAPKEEKIELVTLRQSEWTPFGKITRTFEDPESESAKAAAVAIGGAAAMAAVPAVLTALGFTGAGIAAGSIGAKMMSIAAIANGGGVPAGGLVATLQSAGAAGLSLSSKVILGSTGSALVAHAVGL